MKIRIATRGSKLSLIQTQKVEKFLLKKGFDVEVIKVTTKADL
ncbi:hydroxymethylbilane synthase, partial [Acidianus sp. DSM 29099]|nr:hydroxymethylbilane synthase [Acidianus sp. RZ1]